jgi:hypothetical protein
MPHVGRVREVVCARSVCVCSQSGGFSSIGLLTSQLQSCDLGRRAVRFVSLALQIVMKNNRDLLDVILLYS